MSLLGDARWWATLAAIFAASLLVTWLSIYYAHSRNLFDLPGKRRSHAAPTPRGGGIGIVVAAIFGCIIVGAGSSRFAALPFIAAIAIVAVVGWIDDHRGLAAGVRLLAHFLGCTIALLPIFSGFAPTHPTFGSAWLFAGSAVVIVSCIWSVNLHNFMDGIDGLLSLQAMFVFSALACCEIFDQPQAQVSLLVLWALAVAGFLPFNFPRARIFMGDVGSGVVGLLIGVAVAWQMIGHDAALWTGVIACSAFITDATCTLLSRVLRGRRWYSAHREHLYQWLVRGGLSHARVVAIYMAWNLCVVVPVLYLINRDGAPPRYASVLPPAQSGLAGAICVYALAFGLWIAGRRWAVRRVRKGIH